MYTFAVMDNIVVMGTDPESADIVNPRGNVYGHAAFVVAEHTNGTRTRLHVKTAFWRPDAVEPAQRLCDALTARFTKFGKLPIRFETWDLTFHAYMSAAYCEADTVEWERELDRMEQFA